MAEGQVEAPVFKGQGAFFDLPEGHRGGILFCQGDGLRVDIHGQHVAAPPGDFPGDGAGAAPDIDDALQMGKTDPAIEKEAQLAC